MDKQKPIIPNQPIGKCSECKRDLYPIEFYSCMNDNCPVQRRIRF